jgi:hypothetical protein
MEVPMLDEEEFKLVNDLYGQAFSSTKEFRQKYDLPLENYSIDDLFRPMREKYKELTGFTENNHNAIMHHRISIYGNPCESCGKPLRTPQTNFCAACGKTVEKKS